MLADTRQVHHERLLELELDLVLELAAVRVRGCRDRGAGEIVVPVRAPLSSRSPPATSDFGRAAGWTSDGGALIRWS